MLRENIPHILTIVVVFILLLVLARIYGIDLKTPEIVGTPNVVTFETMTNEDKTEFEHAYCDGSNKPHIVDNWCQTLTKENCLEASCCGLLDGETCVGGNKRGPTYKKRKDLDASYEYWLWRDSCSGTCPVL